METGNECDSDEEYDLQEMEVALYSQIHFDPGDSRNTWSGQSTSPGYRKLILPFKVGVKEIPSRIITSKPLIPQGDFIGFSEENLRTSENIVQTSNSHCEQIITINQSHAHLTDSELQHNIEPKAISEDCYSPESSSKAIPVQVRTEAVEKTTIPCNQIEINVTDKNKNITLKSELQSEHLSSIKKRGSAMSKKKSDKLLPFSITKSSSAMPKAKIVSKPCLKSDITNNSNQPASNLEASSQKKSKPQIEAFLQLSQCNKDIDCSKLKKKVNKINAAIQHRKPPVHLRRPPAVSVRYKQESDTNTDYSDSDTTNSSCSPVKSALVKSASNPAITENVADTLVEKYEEGEVGSSSEGQSKTNSYSETDSDDNMDFLSEPDPNLEFNLAGGVDGLLSNTKSSEETDWKINEQDRFNMNSLLNRYFSPLKIQCRNCRKDGHMSRDCPMPKKSKCLFCGRDGHVYQVCPLGICFNCSAPGHKVNVCPEPKRDWRSRCNRCLMYGHSEQLCPDRWRQFHCTTKQGKLKTQCKESANTLVYCYNCGKKGHFGYECEAPRMDRFVPASYPLIARYDTKKKREHKETENSSKGIHPKDSRKHKASGKMDKKLLSKNNPDLKKKNNNTGKNKSSPLIFPKSGPKNYDPSRFQAGNRDHSKDRSSSAQRGVGISRSGSRVDNIRNENREESVDDLMDDYESHQVHANEWWSSSRDKKKQRSIDMTPRRFPPYEDWKTSKSRFQDEVPHSSYRNEEGQNSSMPSKKRKGTNSPYNAWSPRKKSTKEESRLYNGERQNFESSNKFNYKKSQQDGNMHHSRSWPVMTPARGFQSKNERFVSMKKEFDISVKLRR